MRRTNCRVLVARWRAAWLTALLLTVSAPAWAALPRLVSNGNDSGPGSFRAAIEAANANSEVRAVLFARSLSVQVASDVVYTGGQPLAIFGNGSEVVGDPAALPAETWDGGLFVSTGGANVAITDLAFRNSFNNGVAVFVPASATGRVSLALHAVAIEGARFHGLFFDGQHTTGLNTDDVLHPDCFDPYPVDSPASLQLALKHVTIRGNGTLAGGFDTGTEFEQDGETFLTGCPADFDGVRVDDGGEGGIAAVIASSVFEDNLADGIEFDDSEQGDVVASLIRVRVTGNGETGTVDLDDGFDIDEADEGDLNVVIVDSVFNQNRDEGLDFDEAGAGNVNVLLIAVEANENEDEGFKIDEAGEGDLSSTAYRVAIDGSESQQGVELNEDGPGDFEVVFVESTIKDNDDEGLVAEQAAPGVGTLTLVASDLTGNDGNPSLGDLVGITLENVGSLLDE